MAKIIRASEIGLYLFCRRAWWYRRQGVESENQAEMASGTKLHQQHGRKVIEAGFLQILAYTLLLVAVILIVAKLTNTLLR